MRVMLFLPLEPHFKGVVSRTQAVMLILNDLKSSIPNEVHPRCRQFLKKIEFPDLTDVKISILKKSKEQKEVILADSWCVLKPNEMEKEFKTLVDGVLIPAFRKAVEVAYFELIHWKTRIKKVAGK